MLQRSIDPTPRSSIPKVVGILAIVFASLGFLVTTTVPLGMLDDIDLYVRAAGPIDDYVTWLVISSIAGVLVFGVHLTGGILALRYSWRAPRWLTIYAIAAISLIVADIVLSVVTFPEGPAPRMCETGFDELVSPRIALAVVALPWPIITLVLVNLRGARQSCRS